MEKLKFWLDELDLIAKEFNREYEQLCKASHKIAKN